MTKEELQQKNLSTEKHFELSMKLFLFSQEIYKLFGVDYTIIAVDRNAKQYKEFEKLLKKYEK